MVDLVGGLLLAVVAVAAACWYAIVRMSVDGVSPMWGEIVVQYGMMGFGGGVFLGFLARCADDCNPFASDAAPTDRIESQRDNRMPLRPAVHVRPLFGTRLFRPR